MNTDSSLATSAGTFVAALKHWGLEWVWPARSWQSKELQAHLERLTMAWFPSWEDSRCSVFTSTTRRSGHSATSSCWRRRALKFGGALGYGYWRATSTWSPRRLGRQYATLARLPGVLVKPAAPIFRHGASVRCIDYFRAHGAVARQILEVCVV